MIVKSGPRGRGTSVRILAAGVDLFAQFGYNGVSTRDIAVAAHVNEVTLFRQYSRKRDLYLAVLESELQSVHLRGDLLTNIAEATDGRTAIARTFELVEKTLIHRPKTLRLLHYAVLEFNEDLDLLVRRHLGEFVEVIARYLAPWIQSGELRCSNAKTAILTLISIVVSQDSLQRVFFGKAFGPEPMYAAFMNLVLFERVAKEGSIGSTPRVQVISDGLAERSV